MGGGGELGSGEREWAEGGKRGGGGTSFPPAAFCVLTLEHNILLSATPSLQPVTTSTLNP